MQTISEDIYNRSQSWWHVTVLRSEHVLCRVEIRANAYEEQSHANVSVWSGDGWKFHTSIPTDIWYQDAPSYALRTLEEDHYELFEDVRAQLVERLEAALTL